jgi:hypothetical protein
MSGTGVPAARGRATSIGDINYEKNRPELGRNAAHRFNVGLSPRCRRPSRISLFFEIFGNERVELLSRFAIPLLPEAWR